MESVEKKLSVFSVDILDYHTILVALRCSALFCCLESPDSYDNSIVDLEVRGAINVVEACAQTDGMQKIVFTSSLTAAIWRENICSQKDVDERSWSDQDFCRKMKPLMSCLCAVGMPLLKHCPSRLLGHLPWIECLTWFCQRWTSSWPWCAQQNPCSTMSYLKGAAEMFENGVLAVVDVSF
ncbi:cinnamoyl-CoA reductase 1-like isoform X2 [Hibiscus syriacus]|uniref:Cinnamoyl-CoA reductase 1-like isoform X2 n=1 Tax=Hibiscus syriacus TaxID=106335 RepID=A0A6A2Z565_HIBSY|nr:cinnamoyl-CoA reductase 1-like isoform X2 [Hibiscus syriacus]